MTEAVSMRRYHKRALKYDVIKFSHFSKKIGDSIANFKNFGAKKMSSVGGYERALISALF